MTTQEQIQQMQDIIQGLKNDQDRLAAENKDLKDRVNEEEKDSEDLRDKMKKAVKSLQDENLKLSNDLIKVTQMSQQQAQLNKATSDSTQGLANNLHEVGRSIRPHAPEAYDGAPNKLKPFLTSLRTHFSYFPTSFAKSDVRVNFAFSCMTGTARQWFEPMVRKYQNGTTDAETLTTFGDYEAFEQLITQQFGVNDEEREAEQQLRRLRHTKACTEYCAQFRLITAPLDWDHKALMSYFYANLKDTVKDELYKVDRPSTISEYMNMACIIDQRQFERQREKQGRYNPSEGRFRRYNNNYRSNYRTTATGTHSGPMEIGGVDKKNIKCYNCNEKGHFSKECKKPRKENKKPWNPVPEKKRIGAIIQHDHADLSWTGCHDNSCLVHKEEKEMTGWYPKRQTLEDDYSEQENARHECDYPGTPQVIGMVKASPPPYTPKPEKPSIEDDETTDTDINDEYTRSIASHERDSFSLRSIRTYDAFLMKSKIKYQWMENDHPWIDPRHKQHSHIGWMTCVQMDCPTHFYKKVTKGFFPIREIGKTMPVPLDHTTEQYYKYVSYNERYGRAVYVKRPKPIRLEETVCTAKSPMNCFKKDCPDCKEGRDEILALMRDLWEEGENLYRTVSEGSRGSRYNHIRKTTRTVDLHKQLRRLLTGGYPHILENPVEDRQKKKREAKRSQTKGESSAKGKQREERTTRFLGAVQDQEKKHQLTLEVNIKGRKFEAWVDSGAARNFISPQVVNRHQLPWINKTHIYELSDVEGRPLEYEGGRVTKETESLNVNFGTWENQITFDIIDMGTHPIILGYPWLRENNPHIDWANGQVSCTEQLAPTTCEMNESTEFCGDLAETTPQDTESASDDNE
jgi:hypothetical protein